jgi:hypothetical protein
MIKCSTCGETKSEEYFPHAYGKPQKSRCNECMRKYHKEGYKKRKLMVIRHYGGKCACCGETNIEFLSIDHINGNGNKHRNEVIGKRRAEFYPWLIKNNYPEGFRVLCMNCNTSIGWYGYCPHEKEREHNND